MAQIGVSNLTFYYDGSFDNIFENVSFSIDTNWKLGLGELSEFCRAQKLLLEYKPTMLFVEHDKRFREKIATRTIEL